VSAAQDDEPDTPEQQAQDGEAQASIERLKNTGKDARATGIM
jgi:hypothetical protein